ncbi:MAG: hypothetical protein RIC16_13905 [Rhodospirillales bacterium]
MNPFDALANGLHLDPEAHRRILRADLGQGHETRDVATAAKVYSVVDVLDRAVRSIRYV